jgi:hypothetical protein
MRTAGVPRRLETFRRGTPLPLTWCLSKLPISAFRGRIPEREYSGLQAAALAEKFPHGNRTGKRTLPAVKGVFLESLRGDNDLVMDFWDFWVYAWALATHTILSLFC